jgi:hypothetical protein
VVQYRLEIQLVHSILRSDSICHRTNIWAARKETRHCLHLYVARTSMCWTTFLQPPDQEAHLIHLKQMRKLLQQLASLHGFVFSMFMALALACTSVNPCRSSARDLENESSSGPCGCMDITRRLVENPLFAPYCSRDWLSHHGAGNKSVRPQESRMRRADPLFHLLT